MFRDQRARELAVKLTSGTRFSNETAKVGTPGRNEPLLRSFVARFASNGMKVSGELYAQSPRRVKTRILAGETEPGKRCSESPVQPREMGLCTVSMQSRRMVAYGWPNPGEAGQRTGASPFASRATLSSISKNSRPRGPTDEPSMNGTVRSPNVTISSKRYGSP